MLIYNVLKLFFTGPPKAKKPKDDIIEEDSDSEFETQTGGSEGEDAVEMESDGVEGSDDEMMKDDFSGSEEEAHDSGHGEGEEDEEANDNENEEEDDDDDDDAEDPKLTKWHKFANMGPG